MDLSAEARARIAEAATLPAADTVGLLALVPVLGERPLAGRLRAYCAAAWGNAWTASTEAALIASACERAGDKNRRINSPWMPGSAPMLRANMQNCSMTGRSCGGSPMAAPTVSPPPSTTTA